MSLEVPFSNKFSIICFYEPTIQFLCMSQQPYKTYTIDVYVNFDKWEGSRLFLKGINIDGNYKLWTSKLMPRLLPPPLKWRAARLENDQSSKHLEYFKLCYLYAVTLLISQFIKFSGMRGALRYTASWIYNAVRFTTVQKASPILFAAVALLKANSCTRTHLRTFLPLADNMEWLITLNFPDFSIFLHLSPFPSEQEFFFF